MSGLDIKNSTASHINHTASINISPLCKTRRLEERSAENARKTKEMRLRHLDERARLLAEAATADSSSLCFEISGMEKELQALESTYAGSDVEEEAESNFCVACNKQLRNEKTYGNHLKQKKHRDNVSALKKLLEDDSSSVAHDIDIGQLHLELEESAFTLRDDDKYNDEPIPSESSMKKSKKHRKQQPPGHNSVEPSEEDKNFFSLYDSDVGDRNQCLNEDKKEKSRRRRSNQVNSSEHKKGAESRLDTTLFDKDADEAVNRTKKKSRRKNKADVEISNINDGEANRDSKKCAVCATAFESKNKLFHHLKTSGHATYLGK